MGYGQNVQISAGEIAGFVFLEPRKAPGRGIKAAAMIYSQAAHTGDHIGEGKA